MNTSDVNHQSNDLTESQIAEKALEEQYEKQKALADSQLKRLDKAPTELTWECTPPRERGMSVGMIGFPIVFGSVFGLLSADIWWGLLIFALTAPTVAFLYFTGFQPKTYRYDLTKEGIRYTEEENVPDAVFTFVRTSAWIGAGVCVLVVFVVGPIAFVGAGAAALGAFSFTGFKKTIKDSYVLFYECLQVRYHPQSLEMLMTSGNHIEIDKSISRETRRIYVDQNDYQQFIAFTKPLFESSVVTQVERKRELRDYL